MCPRQIIKHTLLVVSLVFLLTNLGFSQHGYKDGINLIGSSNDTSLLLYISLTMKTKTDQLSEYTFQFTTKSEALDTEPLIFQDSSYLGSKNTRHYLQFDFRLSDISNTITIQIINKKTGFQSRIDYDIIESHPFILMNSDSLPIVNYWMNPGTVKPTVPSLSCYYYNHEFKTGLPPMTTRDESVSKAMIIDSTFDINSSVNLTQPGLYLFYKDSSDTKALAIRVEEKYYPKFTSIKELILPLKYITSKNEQVRLDSIGENKRLFDKFWLELAQNPERAVKIIRTFYERVEYVNRNFTTFKEGWKTDKGLIYIVMGKPDIIQIVGNKETWTYRQDRRLPQRTYQFLKTNTIFSPAHYVLIREKKHAKPWFDAIDLLRKGIIEQ